MDVLAALGAAGDRVAGREELHRAVWGDTYVGYHSLARAVSQARRALADLVPETTFIETVPKRGFRLTQPVRPAVQKVARVQAIEETSFSNAWIRPMVSRVGYGSGALLALGLLMHALGTHGTPLHLVGASGVVVATVWWPRPDRPN